MSEVGWRQQQQSSTARRHPNPPNMAGLLTRPAPPPSSLLPAPSSLLPPQINDNFFPGHFPQRAIMPGARIAVDGCPAAAAAAVTTTGADTHQMPGATHAAHLPLPCPAFRPPAGVLQVEAMAQLGGIIMIDPKEAAQQVGEGGEGERCAKQCGCSEAAEWKELSGCQRVAASVWVPLCSGLFACSIHNLPSLAPSQTNFFFGGVDNLRWRKPVVPGDVLVSWGWGGVRPGALCTGQRLRKAGRTARSRCSWPRHGTRLQHHAPASCTPPWLAPCR